MFSALEDIEFENFIEPLRESLEAFRKANKEKKSNKAHENKTNNDAQTVNSVDDEVDEEMNDQSAMIAEEPTDGTEIEEWSFVTVVVVNKNYMRRILGAVIQLNAYLVKLLNTW